MSSKLDRIANLLASGMKPALVAKITAVSPSYISQLIADPDFKQALEELKAAKVDSAGSEEEEDKSLKDKFQAAEHKIVDHILDRLDMMGDGHVIAALRTIGDRNDAMRKHSLLTKSTSALAALGGGQATMRMVELTIPACAVPELILGKNSEIISIGGRDITPMPVNTLQSLINSQQIEIEESVYDQL